MFGEFSPARKIDFQNREANRQAVAGWSCAAVDPRRDGASAERSSCVPPVAGARPAVAGRILRTAIAPHLAPGVILRGGRSLPLRRAAYDAVEPSR
jgi:hypothetical protein